MIWEITVGTNTEEELRGGSAVLCMCEGGWERQCEG